jgi:hypothetical protein
MSIPGVRPGSTGSAARRLTPNSKRQIKARSRSPPIQSAIMGLGYERLSPGWPGLSWLWAEPPAMPSIGFSGANCGLSSAHFTPGSSQFMHWRSVRPENVTTGTIRFPHFGQCVIPSMRSSQPELATAIFVPLETGAFDPYQHPKRFACSVANTLWGPALLGLNEKRAAETYLDGGRSKRVR